MSKTDKTRPWWVQKFDPTMPSSVHHDHRHGECVEETFDIAEAQAHRRAQQWRHRSNGSCPRYAVVTEYCRSSRDVRYWGECLEHFRDAARGYRLVLLEDGTVVHREVPPFACPGHQRLRMTSPAAPCLVCEETEGLMTTCDRQFDRRYGWQVTKVSGHSAGRAGKRLEEKSRRAQARQVLREALREWNADGDTDLEPDPTMPITPWWW